MHLEYWYYNGDEGNTAAVKEVIGLKRKTGERKVRRDEEIGKRSESGVRKEDREERRYERGKEKREK